MGNPGTQRFVALDGLRGVAALCVLFLHVTLWFGDHVILRGAGLAVDFFFCLSGFVLTHAYAARLSAGLSLRSFMAERLRRLYPLIAAGYVLGAAFAALRVLGGRDPLSDLTMPLVAKSLILSLLLIPHEAAPIGYGIFPLNDPTWSLFFEILVNFGFGLGIAALGWRRFRIVAACVAVASLLFLTGHATIIQGFTLARFDVGVERVALSFLLGAGLQRVMAARVCRLPFGGDVTFLVLTGVMTLCFVAEGYYASQGWEIVCIGLIFPAIVAAGSLARPARLHRLCHAMGELSYPLYVLHAPVVFATVSIGLRTHLFTGAHDVTLLAAASATAVAASWLALVAYDRPVRAYLRRKSGPSLHATAHVVVAAGT